MLYVEVSYSVSDGRTHKAREGIRYRLKARNKELAKDCIVNVLQCTADRKCKQIDSLHIEILRKDRLIEKKDKVIEDLHAELRRLMLPPVVCAPLPVVEERYGFGQILEEPQVGEKRSMNQMETETLDLFFESLGYTHGTGSERSNPKLIQVGFRLDMQI